MLKGFLETIVFSVLRFKQLYYTKNTFKSNGFQNIGNGRIFKKNKLAKVKTNKWKTPNLLRNQFAYFELITPYSIDKSFT